MATSFPADQLESLLGALAVPVCLASIQAGRPTELIAANPAFTRLTGVASGAGNARPLQAVLPASVAVQFASAVERSAATGQCVVCSIDAADEGRSLHWRVTFAPVGGAADTSLLVMATVEDNGELLRLQRMLHRSEERRFNLVHAGGQAMLVHRRFRPVFANEAAARLFGFDSAGELLRLDSLLPLVAETALRTLRASRRRFDRGQHDCFVAQFECRRRDGGALWIDYRSTHVDWDAEPAEQAVIFDISERHQLIESLKRQAATDALTGLLNRDRFLAIAARALSAAGKPRSAGALRIAMIDIDHFKGINDTYGHAAGDEALRNVAAVLKSTLRDSDVMARFGGEEFAVLLVDAGHDAALRACERARRACADADIRVWGARRVSLTVSCGLSGALGSDGSIDAGLREADRALYAAKGAGRNRTAVVEAGFVEVAAP